MYNYSVDVLCSLQSFASHLKKLILTDHGESRKATWKDVVVRVLRADVPRGAQEEAPGRAGGLRGVLKEMLGEVEGTYDQFRFGLQTELFKVSRKCCVYSRHVRVCDEW